MLDYLEKYVTHATIQNTKLEELSFKNFKRALESDIKENINTNGMSREHPQIKSYFDDLLKEAKKLDIDTMFKILAHQLKDSNTKFSSDYLRTGAHFPKFEGEHVHGGIFDLFIRKCCLSFNKMMFEEVVNLHENYMRYVRGEEYILEHARTSLSQFFEHKLKRFEFDVTQKPHSELHEQFERINVPVDYKK